MSDNKNVIELIDRLLDPALSDGAEIEGEPLAIHDVLDWLSSSGLSLVEDESGDVANAYALFVDEFSSGGSSLMGPTDE